MSTGTEGAEGSHDPWDAKYPEKFVTNDAVYTLQPVEFSPVPNPDIGSLLDVSLHEMDRIRDRAEKMGIGISSADEKEVERRLAGARRTVKEVLRKLANDAQERQDSSRDAVA
jgi:hypothetical protein